jgi:hypothetical protein
MKKFLITEVEKARILGMHYNAMGKSLVNEEVGDPGTINAAEREQEYVDGGMSYIGLDYYDENRNRKAYYYQCTPSIHSTADDWNKPGNRAGDFTDGQGNFIGTASQLGLKGDYNTQLKNACQNIYTFYNNHKKTFCANPKNKTNHGYKWLCPQETPQPQVAAATATWSDKAMADMAKSAKSREEKMAAIQAETAKVMADTTFLSPEKEKAQLDLDAKTVGSILLYDTYLSEEQKMFLKRKINTLIKTKPEYKKEPYYLNINF